MTIKYRLENGNIVEIPEEDIASKMRALDISEPEAIELWLWDAGHISNDAADELNEKASKIPVSQFTDVSRTNKTARKPPVRKPDPAKREIIFSVAEFLANYGSMQTTEINTLLVENVLAANLERIISFSIGEDNYELTLTKKRRPRS